ncbi:hypothetical protein C8R48DRAFT_779977 [Suillus tomentosus]|nr:hypothetical protein C8R48DRAFT_779977 [Suillus tomentosus]
MAVAEDAFKLLGRVADAFDDPSSCESRKDFRVNTIKIRKPQTSRSSQESQVQHACYARREPSFFDISYIYDDDELADMASMTANRSCASSSETIRSLAGITSHDDAFYACDDTVALDESPCSEMTKMLSPSSSPLDRLNNLARAELKKTGWFERPDQWSIVNMGLSSPITDTRGPISPPKTPPATLSILPSTLAITTVPLPSFAQIPPPDSPMQTHSPASFKASTPNGKYSSSSRDSFPDFSTLSYAPRSEPEPPRRFGVSSRVKQLMKRVLHVNVGVHPSRRSRQSLLVGVGLRPASMAGASSGTWAFASIGSTHTQAGNRWSGLWH